ncbi:MAG TPA: transglycosylase SLT domain-containing protein, partial [Dehalococcoidia bacterium]|nr:transglycosylase SLT domain-containing protein [Dehalococcoidia bacterium]
AAASPPNPPAATTLETARALAREGGVEGAAWLYTLAAVAGPPGDRAQAWFERAVTLRAMGRYDAALRSLDFAAKAGGPLATDALWLRAVILRDAGDDAAALASLDAYRAAGGGHPAARALRAELLAATGSPDEAASEATALLASLPEASAERLALSVARGFDRAGDAASALAWYRDVYARTDDPNALLRIAQIERDAGDAAWVADATQVVMNAPSSDAALDALAMLDAAGVPVDGYARGLALYRHLDYAGAERAFLDYRDAGGPLAGRAAFYLGAIAEERGDREGAIAWYSRSLEEDPGGPLADDALWWRASLRESAGDIEGAIEDLRRLAAAYPETEFGAEAGFRVGLLLYREGKAAEAAEAFRAAPAPDTESAHRARYWEARALAAAGRQADADALLQDLASSPEVDYYTLRAAGPVEGGAVVLERGEPDWAAIEEWLASVTGAPPVVAFDDLVFAPAWARGLELLSLGLEPEADAEFATLLENAGSDPNALYQLARAFRKIGRTHLSARAAARLLTALPEGAWREAPRDLVRLAYPVEYLPLLATLQRQRGVDPLVMLALIRQESFFDPLAGSSAGALGLTQVIPSTGREVAASLGLQDFDPSALFRPAVSIAVGGAYLASQIERFDGNVYHALAAYNGGPGTAAAALDRAGDDVDLFVELLPYAETRLYVRRVVTHLAFYRYAYAGLDRPALPGP